LLLVTLLFAGGLARGEDKRIRLRNEVIVTLAGQKSPAAVGSQSTNESRLFLIQFEEHPLPAQRAELRSLGVDVLRYVPDDAFIARLTNAAPDQVRALSYVRWVGPYLARHKVHPRLTAAFQRTNAPLAANILLSPRVTADEIAGVRGLLASVVYESHLRQGVILRGVLAPAALEKLAVNKRTVRSGETHRFRGNKPGQREIRRHRIFF